MSRAAVRAGRLRSPLVAGELLVEILPGFSAEYWGTREQLEAEGLVPDGLAWPARSAVATWRVGILTHWLHRVPPAGFSGARAEWETLDNWVLRVLVPERDLGWYQRHRDEVAAAEQLRLLRGSLTAIDDARREQVYAACRARRDRRFQRLLKELMPVSSSRRRRADPSESGGPA